jgi:hypothetical protein
MEALRLSVWQIIVSVEGKTVHSIEVPVHRLTDDGAKAMITALAVKYEPLSFEESVRCLLNRRSGGPQMGVFDQPTFFMDPLAAKAGFQITGPTVDVVARYQLSPESCDRIRKIRNA